MPVEFAEGPALRIRIPLLKSYQCGSDGATRRGVREAWIALSSAWNRSRLKKIFGLSRTNRINDQDAELGLGWWISAARESLTPLCKRGNLTRKIVPVSPVCSTAT